MSGARISAAVLDTLGVRPALGRFLTDDDDRDGAQPVVILSDALWRDGSGRAQASWARRSTSMEARTRLSV